MCLYLHFCIHAGIMKLQTCHFVVWTEQRLQIFVIPFNKAAWDDNLVRLRHYYFDKFVPLVVARENGQKIHGTTRMKCAAQQAPLGSTLQAPAEPAPATETAGGIQSGRDDVEDTTTMTCEAPPAQLGSTLQAPSQQATPTDTAGGIKRGRDDAEDSQSISLPDSSESDSDDDEEDPDADSIEA